MDARRKRILFRAQHCGMKENDIILGGFAEARVEGLSEADLDAFEALLNQADNDVFTWVSGRTAPPAEFDTNLMRQILDHNKG
ncbi:MAG: succinate dehydrogenase assembly factor 2 [Rhodospirillales bacterium CG15_BIG_FIL_POST_REV_8_21_14_020_66_15]|nr:MAG: succinate dehydrogenase assembly factor 2 [Rhodospirillales bacterium CG15_BIG_FIL_POST_REV_8_21_14_020_66_15]